MLGRGVERLPGFWAQSKQAALHSCLVADIPARVRIILAPLLGSLSEKGHVEQTDLRRIDQPDLVLSQFYEDQVLLDGIGVETVVDLGQFPAYIPTELGLPILLESLELLDHV